MINVAANNPNSINATTLDAEGKELNIDPSNLNAKGATSSHTLHQGSKIRSVAFHTQFFDTVKNVILNRNWINFNR